MHNCIMSFTVNLNEATEVQSLSPNIDSLDGDRSPRVKCCIEKPRSLEWNKFIAFNDFNYYKKNEAFFNLI